jgi:hypothetical protein
MRKKESGRNRFKKKGEQSCGPEAEPALSRPF